MTKTGSVVGNVASFEIELSNTGKSAASDVSVIDYMPGLGLLDWEVDEDASDSYFACGFYLTDFPNQEILDCEPGTIFADPADGAQTVKVVVRATLPENTCLSLDNAAVASASNHPDVTALGSIIVGFCEGRMTGGGSIFSSVTEVNARNNKSKTSSVRVTHGFEIRCDVTDPRQNLEVNWANPNGNQNNFHLLKLTSATCLDDPNIDQRPPKSAGFDTFIGTAEGRCNNQPAIIEFTFTDQGEPGTKDTAEYLIKGDACYLNTGEDPINLTKGNQQTHKD